MSRYSFLFVLFFIGCAPKNLPVVTNTEASVYADTSTQLVEALKNKVDHQRFLDSIQNVKEDELNQSLSTDAARYTFWINVYNAYIQLSLSENPEQYEDRRTFFSERKYKVARRLLSFEDIEHGIIRRSQLPLGLGYIPDFFPGKFERTFRVEKRDPRVHFALNCGAKDCPAVAAYENERLFEQFDISTRQHLAKSSSYEANNKKVKITPLFSWFRGDWGSKRKQRKFLKRYDAIPDGADPKIEYTGYDWTLDLGNYQEL